MDLKAGKHLVAPAINNISCTNNRFAGHFFHQIGPFDVIQALFIVLLTFLVISANLMVILVINSRRYAAYIHPQPRYLLTSLALNDLAIGLLIIPFSALPALLHCWPYGEIFCQIQVKRNRTCCLRHYYEELYHNKVLLYWCAWLLTAICACYIHEYIISDPVRSSTSSLFVVVAI
uniref:G-protein coupled receptors family 1 profile domain-containing protein n=1 Tax=Anopheles culicifacies TaxID=139723 RepID=A0A182MP87_9DIPT